MLLEQDKCSLGLFSLGRGMCSDECTLLLVFIIGVDSNRMTQTRLGLGSQICWPDSMCLTLKELILTWYQRFIQILHSYGLFTTFWSLSGMHHHNLCYLIIQMNSGIKFDTDMTLGLTFGPVTWRGLVHLVCPLLTWDLKSNDSVPPVLKFICLNVLLKETLIMEYVFHMIYVISAFTKKITFKHFHYCSQLSNNSSL